MDAERQSAESQTQIKLSTLKNLQIRLQNYYTRAGALAMGGAGISFGSMGSTRQDLVKGLFAALGLIGFFGGRKALKETDYGGETVEAYSSTIEHFTEHGKIDDRWLRKSIYEAGSGPRAYCWRRGIELAMRDLGKKSQWDTMAEDIGIKKDHDKS